MSPSPAPTQAYTDAQRWFARLLAPDCTSQEREAFERWREARPEHAAAYARVERVMGRVGELRDDPAIREAAEAALQPVPDRSSRTRDDEQRWAHGWRRPAFAALAAGLVIAAGAAVIYLVPWRTPIETYATAVGEQRRVELADGSEILLDTDTRLEVRYGQRQRRLTFHDGRVQYTVAHDPRRPFVVETPGAVVTARGTEFQTRLLGGSGGEATGDTVTITLLEGVVTVESTNATPRRSTTLRPGEEVTYSAGGVTGARGAWSKGAIDLEAATGWTRGRLVFRGERLATVIEEANRYSDTKLRIADPALADLRVSGTFEANDQTSLIRALEALLSLDARPVSDTEILLTR